MNSPQIAALDPAITAAPPSTAATLNDQPDRPAAIAFVLDDSDEAALRGGLPEALGSLQIRRGGIKAAARALEHDASPRVLIVDISDADDSIRALDELALVCAPDTKVLVIGERTDIEFYRDVTRQLGVDEYISKPLTRDGVANLVGPFLAGASHDRAANHGGRVIAVCGARGGVGATTVAVNLALQLAEQTRSHVALLDLHLRGGHSALMLGGRPGTGLRLALEDPDRADALFLERLAIPFGDRLRVIAAEEPFDAEPSVTAKGVTRVMELLRQRFNFTLVDLPMPPSSAEREVLRLARQVLVVFCADVASLRDADQVRRLATTLAGAGRTMMVLNRASAPGALKMRLIEEALGTAPEAVIPDFPKQLVSAANVGEPALPKNEAFRRALAPLTQEISGLRQERKRTSLFRWLVKS